MEEYIKWAEDFGPKYSPAQIIELGGLSDKYIIGSRGELVLNNKNELSSVHLRWLKWYCLYYFGNRDKQLDKVNITIWKRVTSRLALSFEADEGSISVTKLNRWGWDHLDKFTDNKVDENSKAMTVATRCSLNTESFREKISDLFTYNDSPKFNKLLNFSPTPVFDTLDVLSSTAVSLLPLITVKEENGKITVTGYNYKRFLRLTKRVLNTSKLKNIFIRSTYRYFTIPSFYAIELIRCIDLILESSKDNSLSALRHKLVKETWVGEVTNAPPLDFKYENLDRLTLTLLNKQREFLNEYREMVPKLGLNGWLLAAAPGTGKTIAGLAWHLVNDFDTTIYIVPNNSVDEVWGDHLKRYFKKTPKFFLSRDGYEINGDEEFIVCHYEQLENLKSKLSKFRGKRIGLWVDESHNFNELTSERTNLMIYIGQEYCEGTVLASGTPLKAVGKELVPLFRLCDHRFTTLAEKIFIKTFGSTKGSVLELLEFRVSRSCFKIAKEEVVKNVINETMLEVKIPDHKAYLVSTVRRDIATYVNERITEITLQKETIVEEYFNYINALDDTVTGNDKHREYMSAVRKMHKGFSPYSDVELIKFCSMYEKDYILPGLIPSKRKDFKKKSALYKYPSLVVRGEALGRVLTRRRIECIESMVLHSNMEDVIEGANKKTVIFTNYVDVVDALDDHLTNMGYKPLVIYGATNHNLKESMDKFTNDPKCKVIIATYNSLSTAVPLLAASSIVLFDSPFRDYIIQQSVSRLDRYGQDSDIDLIRVSLDTGDDLNLSTRSIDIAAESKEVVDAILKLGTVGDSVSKSTEGLTLATEYFNLRNGGLTYDTLPEDLYHISFDKKLPNILKPQLPAGSLKEETSKDKWNIEPNVERICFSETLEGAFRAIYMNIQDIVEKHGKDGITFTVYKRINGKNDVGVSPETLDSTSAVWDARVTREWWVLDESKIKNCGTLTVYVDDSGDWLQFKPTHDPKNETYDHTPAEIELEVQLRI